MDYEKKYNEALKRAKDFMNGIVQFAIVPGESIVLYIFPELRESEDEKIRTSLYTFFQGMLEGHEDCYKVGGFVKFEGIDVKSILAYLEKQKEQKPASISCGHENDKPAEWSEEDEKKIHFLSRLIEFQVKDGEYCFGEGACAISKQEAIEMLQSLRPSWKPSEEQMKALEIAFRKDGDDKYRSTINSLYNDLKKL